ncbi:MAG: hypothetical protein ACLUJG_03690 [Lawsonibacter sp.]
MLDLLATKGTWGKGMLNPLQELLPEFNSFLDAQEEYPHQNRLFRMHQRNDAKLYLRSYAVLSECWYNKAGRT